MARDGRLRTIFRSHLPDAMWASIETGLTEGGVPDSWYQFYGGVSGWIEHKRTPLKIRPGQVAWLSRCARLGGRCYVAVRDHDDLLLYRGADAACLHAGGLRAAEPEGRWTGGPARWDWNAIRDIITQPPRRPSP